jgi:hypothetical protein
MNQHAEKITPEQTVEAIFALDLDPIKLKLMDKDEGHGWTRVEADRHEMEYKRFLALLAKFPDEVIAPNTDVDKFWHGHILDTMKYAEDCQHVFGYFLHHFPYFGMRDEEDAANLASAAVNMQRLYQQEFGEQNAQATGYCAVASEAKQEQATAYCAVAKASYCAVTAGEVETKQKQAAYCAVVAGKGRPSLGDSSAYCAVAKPSYCARVAAGEDSKQTQAAYCAVAKPSYCARAAASDDAKQPQSAYCAIANVNRIVVGKGRPKLERTTDSYSM